MVAAFALNKGPRFAYAILFAQLSDGANEGKSRMIENDAMHGQICAQWVAVHPSTTDPRISDYREVDFIFVFLQKRELHTIVQHALFLVRMLESNSSKLNRTKKIIQYNMRAQGIAAHWQVSVFL